MILWLEQDCLKSYQLMRSNNNFNFHEDILSCWFINFAVNYSRASQWVLSFLRLLMDILLYRERKRINEADRWKTTPSDIGVKPKRKYAADASYTKRNWKSRAWSKSCLDTIIRRCSILFENLARVYFFLNTEVFKKNFKNLYFICIKGK